MHIIQQYFAFRFYTFINNLYNINKDISGVTKLRNLSKFIRSLSFRNSTKNIHDDFMINRYTIKIDDNAFKSKTTIYYKIEKILRGFEAFWYPRILVYGWINLYHQK